MTNNSIEQLKDRRNNLVCQARKIEAAFGKSFIPENLIKEIDSISISIETKEADEKASKKVDELVEKIMTNAGMVRSTTSNNKWHLKDNIEMPFHITTDAKTYDVLKVYGVWYVDDDMHTQLLRPLFTVSLSDSKFVQNQIDNLLAVAEKESDDCEKYFNSAAIRYVCTTLRRVMIAMGFNQAEANVTAS